MGHVANVIVELYQWAKRDYQQWPLRFCIEILAWAISVGCSITMALTVPNPPLLFMYPFWISGCCMYAWASWTRGSFGMLANYCLLVTIDIIGLVHMISKTV